MKSLILIATILFASASFADTAETVCPNWPVTLTEVNSADGSDKVISIIVVKDLIKDQNMLSNREMEISSSRFLPYVEIKGNNVEVSLIRKVLGKTVDEQWTKLGSITQTEIMGNKICHNLTLEGGINIAEITVSYRPDCGFFPAGFCKKQHQNKLKITKNINGKEYYTTSITGISVLK